MKNFKPVLLVEDDVIDAMTVRRAFKDLKLTNPLAHVTDGEEALDYLKNPDNPTPCVILLDLNMPRMNGVEFIEIVKADPVLKMIPIVVFTTSSDRSDITESYRRSVAGYIVKPIDYHAFVDTVAAIGLYWTINEMPPDDSVVQEANATKCASN
jgi:CheY-like chemotaxis protein